MRRSILCIIIIASLIFCSTSIAFANPLDPWSASQAHTVTQGVMSIDSTLSNVYTGLTALYNYLKNNGDGVVEGLLVLANRVSNIINTLDYYLPLQNSVLQNLYSFFAAPSGDTRDIWDLLSQISANTTATSTALNTTNSELLTINSHIDGVEGSLTSIGSRLDTVNVNLQSLESINWINSNAISFSLNGIDYYNSFSELTSVSITTQVFYVKINYGDYNYLGYLNLQSLMQSSNYYNTPVTVQFFVDNIENFPDYYLNTAYRNINLFIYPFSSFPNRNVVIKFSSDRIVIAPSSNCYFKCIPFDSNDFYTVDNFIQNHKKSEDTTLSDIKNILIDIDNNSDFIQNNNDLEINVDIDAADGQGVTAIILKLQDLFDFGVGLQEFLVTLNEFDNLHWFTRLETYEQVNYDPRTNLGYQDLYD